MPGLVKFQHTHTKKEQRLEQVYYTSHTGVRRLSAMISSGSELATRGTNPPHDSGSGRVRVEKLVTF